VDLATVRFFLPSPSRASAVILAFFHVFSPSSLPLPPTVSSPAATHSDRHNLPPCPFGTCLSETRAPVVRHSHRWWL
jgi:hypothetical protein